MNKLKWILVGVAISAIPAAFAASINFSDMDENDWYYQAVMNLQELDIIEGYDDETYRADNDVNRAEMAIMLDRLTESMRNGCVYIEMEGDNGIQDNDLDLGSDRFFFDGDTLYEDNENEFICQNGYINHFGYDPE